MPLSCHYSIPRYFQEVKLEQYKRNSVKTTPSLSLPLLTSSPSSHLTRKSLIMFLEHPPRYCCCCSVAKSCPTLCDPMNCSTPGFPVLHYLLEFTQTHVHWVADAIQPSHPLSPASPLALNFSQHQHLFQWVSSASGGQNIGASASVLPMNSQGWSPLGLTGLISMRSKGLYPRYSWCK